MRRDDPRRGSKAVTWSPGEGNGPPGEPGLGDETWPDDETRVLPSTDTDSFLAPGGGMQGPLVDEMHRRAVAGEGAAPGRRVGQIRLVRLLGHGGMGTVFEGYDEVLERRVAVKTIHAGHRFSAQAKARFLREARVLSKLDHPGICRIYNLIEESDADYLVLELIDGANLADAAVDLTADQKLHAALGIAEALAAAHDAQIVHRDLKPENVMLTPEGEVKVLDFGISRSLATPAQAARERESGGLHRVDLTAAGSLVGTLRYMSPEQAAGETVTVATDLYSFGVLLQELFTGEIPYGDLDFGTLLERVQEGRTGPLGDLDPELRRLLEQLLARDPGARPGAGDVASALRRIVDRPKRRRRRRWLAAATLAVVLALAATGWAAHRAARPPALMTDGGRVLLMPFVNETGDPSKSWVEHGLARMVAETLGGVDRLDLVGPSVLQRTLDQQRLTVEALTDDDIDRLTRAFGADVAIVTSAEARGERYALAYTAHRPGTKHREHRVQADDLAVAAGVLGQRLAQRLAPGSLVVELQDQFSTDPFLNRLYAMGVERLRGAGTAACPYFRVCIDREPGFARARGMLAECLSQTGAYPEAEALWLEVIEQARRQGDPHLEAAALLDLGNLKTNLSRLDEAEADLERALDLFRQQGDRIYEAETLVSVSGLRASRGDWPGAQGLAERAVAIQEETGDRIGLARSLHTLGVTHSEQWNLEAAVDTFERAVEIERELGIPYMLATTLNSLGNTLPYLERFEEAEVTLLEALTLARSVGNPSLEGMVISNLGNILLATERPAEAAERFAEALVIFEELGLTPRIAYSAINLAIALAKTERYDEGRPHLATARDFLPPGDVVLVFAEGLYAFGDGDPRRAVELLERAKGLAGEDGWGESDEVLLLRYRAAAAGG